MTRKDKKPAERTLRSLLEAWAKSHQDLSIQPMVHGSDPLGGRYPAAGLDISFSLGVAFPPAIPDLVDASQRPAVRALVAQLDDSLVAMLMAAGYANLRPYWDDDGEHFAFAHYFPPGFGFDVGSLARAYGVAHRRVGSIEELKKELDDIRAGAHN